MSKNLLPQDIHLLAMKWASPDHFSRDEAVGPVEWRKIYQGRLEQTIADWLAKGLFAYQYPQYRIDAFVPISHLVGTARDSISYIDSLVDIASELETVRDPRYRSHPNEAFSDDDFVLLGECFAGAIAKASEILASRFGEYGSQQEKYYQALVDSLTLIQAVKPHNAGSALFATWSELNGKAKNRFEEILGAHPWVIEHAFALACYPACNIAAGPDIKMVISNLEATIKGRRAPAILKSDLKACRELISVVKLSPIERIPVGQSLRLIDTRPISPDPIKSWYTASLLSPRQKYNEIGECYAR